MNVIQYLLLTLQITRVVGSSLVSTCWTSPQPHWDVGMLQRCEPLYMRCSNVCIGAIMSLLVLCVRVCVLCVFVMCRSCT